MLMENTLLGDGFSGCEKKAKTFLQREQCACVQNTKYTSKQAVRIENRKVPESYNT
jgi:hypothetical protein